MKNLLFITMVFLLVGCTGKTKDSKQQVSEKPAADTVVEEIVEPVEPVEDVLQPETEEVADPTTVRYLDALPADYKDEDDFGLILDYGDYAMDVSAWPMSDGDWLITYHWCMEEDEGMVYYENEDGEVVSFEYNDPFEGQSYPVIHNPDLSFSTRNYGGETIHFYAAPDSDEILCSTDYKEIGLDVIEADLKTRRLLVQSNPKDWCWGEPEDEWDAEYRHPFVDLKGWIDEEWVCGNTVTTCP